MTEPASDTKSAAREQLSLIVPVYNEAENFPKLLKEIEANIPQPFQLYVVYDFDGDTTVPVVQEYAQTRPWLHLYRNTLGKGVVYAITAGFQAVGSGPALVIMADLSDDLTQVPRLLELYGQGYRIVCPSRFMRGGKLIGGPPLKRWLSRCAGLSLYYLAGFPSHDATNNYRLYDAALVNELGIESTGGFELALELTAKAFARGVKITEIPTTWRDRTAGESRFQLWKWLPKYLRWYAYAFKAKRIRNANPVATT